jgi:predicted secreted protein
MGWVTGILLYTVIWWIALFAVLPIGTRPVASADAKSGWRGAPERPRILFMVIVTSAVSTVLWLAIYFVVTSDYLSFRSGILALPRS